ncbi:MAG: Hpt domain-containing protein [Clostridia bacterium]|nr:Hpt domain-containing protein [Clostridia bacterium]
MITMDALKAFGANTDEGLKRCMGKESFYLMLVGSALNCDQINKLIDQIKSENYGDAFETAHALKGIYANLSLTPLSEIVSPITEHLRANEVIDYIPLTDELLARMKKLMELAGM